ncbi:hypothetical protein [Agromyces silvae]|uniref:hypothetical protein n=1 Tax=Agromyces silvae TaxID=3388266 RepID=UPI00280B0AAC|nr:hypothetical protein [Agromyces protaetiae]
MTRMFRSRRGFVAVVSGLVAAATLAAPMAAVAAPSEGENAVWRVVDAELEDGERVAQVGVIFQCAAGQEATVRVRLFQDASRQGVATGKAKCLGAAQALKLQVASAGDPWQYGRSAAYAQISDSATGGEQAYVIKMQKALDLPK